MSNVAYPDLTEEQLSRYARQISLPEIGVEGQRKLLRARVLVVGAGGLGSPALLYLAAAGVGALGVIDGDCVELSNLQRQILYGSLDIGRRKVVSAEAAIAAANPACGVEAIPARLTAANVRHVVKGYDIVLDCSDNFSTRFLVADGCWFERVPLVSAAVYRFEGQLMTILPGEGDPCYRCLYAEPPPLEPDGGDVGPVGTVPGVMGSLQAMEALKIILGIGTIMSRTMLVYDALENEFEKVGRARDPACPLCGPDATITDVVEID